MRLIRSTIAVVAIALLSVGCAMAPPAEQVTVATIEDIRSGAVSLDGAEWVSTGQPDEAALRVARDAGVVTVVDMRTAGEDRGLDEQAAVEALGMRYIAFPVASATDINAEKAEAFDSLLRGVEGPVLLHCRTGNRVGAMFALRAGNQGVDEEAAVEIGRKAGLTSLEKAVREALAATP